MGYYSIVVCVYTLFFLFLFFLYCLVLFEKHIKQYFSCRFRKKIKTQQSKLWSISRENAKLNLGFPWCRMNCKLDSRTRISTIKKPSWNALWRNILRDLTKLICEVRRTHNNCSFNSIFACILIIEAAGQVDAIFSVKYFLIKISSQNHFWIAKTDAKTEPRHLNITNWWCHRDYQPNIYFKLYIKPTGVSALLWAPCMLHVRWEPTMQHARGFWGPAFLENSENLSTGTLRCNLVQSGRLS